MRGVRSSCAGTKWSPGQHDPDEGEARGREPAKKPLLTRPGNSRDTVFKKVLTNIFKTEGILVDLALLITNFAARRMNSSSSGCQILSQ
jgi:hypothetical protein